MYEVPAQPVIFSLVFRQFVVGYACSSSRDENSKFENGALYVCLDFIILIVPIYFYCLHNMTTFTI